MNMHISLLLSLLAGLSTIIGGFIIFFKFKNANRVVVYSLSLSMTIMLIVSLFELLPSSILILLNNYGKIYGTILIILIFSIGYLIIDLINKNIKTNSSLYRVGILSFISLILHNIPEGIIVFMSSYTNFKLGIKMCISIIFHNIPEGISIAVPVYYSNKSRGQALFLTLLSGIAEPIGALLSYIFLKKYINEIFISFILTLVSGLMISLSFNDILREITKYNNKLEILYGIVSGLIITSFLIIL